MNPTPPEEKENPISSNEDELAQLRAELQSLKQYVHSNRRRIRNSRALNALLVVLVPLFFLNADFHFGKEWGGNVRSRDFDAGDAISLAGVALTALGVVSSEELEQIFRRK